MTRRRTIHIAATVSILVMSLGLPVFIYFERGMERYYQLAGELEELNRANRAQTHRNLDLKRYAEALTHRADVMDQVARNEYGYLRTGEIVFKFDDHP